MRNSNHPFFVACLSAMLAACESAAPVADDIHLLDQVTNDNYVLTLSKDAWTEHLSLAPVDDIVRSAWVPTEAGPGCAVGLVEDGEITYLQGYGMASMGDAGDPPAKWSHNTVSPVGSISKTITALSLRALDREWSNSLDMTDTVDTHLAAGQPIADIPLVDLLSHGSGLQKWPEWEANSLPNTCGPGELVDCDEAAWLMSHPRTAFHQYDDNLDDPGNPKYSNAGYSILGSVIDELTHDAFWLLPDERGYEAYTWHRVGRFLGDDTYEGQMLSLALMHSWRVQRHDIPNYAHGYDLDGNLLEAWADIAEGWEGPSGGWVMTIGDLSRLIAALMNGQIVEPATLAEMQQYTTSVLGGYGQGMAMESDTLYWHGGDIGGYAAVWAWWPHSQPNQFGVALICNRAGDGKSARDLLEVAKDIRNLYGSSGAQSQSTLPQAGSAGADQVDGQIFELDLSTARIVEPADFAVPLAGGERLFLEVKKISPTLLKLHLLAGEDPGNGKVKRQYLDTVSYTSGYGFRTDALPDWQFSTMGGGRIKVTDLMLEAAFASRGLSLADVKLHATIDLRNIGHMADAGWEQICRNRDPRSAGCTACEDGREACLRVKAEWIGGPRYDAAARQ